MREHNSVTNEYGECWDTGTYQTGPSKPQKGQSVLITVLLMAVILLGGIASALGIMNIRLLAQLVEQQSSELYLSVDTTQTEDEISDDFFHSDKTVEAQLPEEEVLQLRLGIRVQELNALCRQYWQLSSGVEVVAAEDGTQLQEGDILVSINGEKLTEISQLYSIVDAAQEKDVLRLGVLRAGQHFTVDVTVENP